MLQLSYMLVAVHFQAAGKLPDFIVNLFDNEAKNQPDSRKFQTSIINNVLAKQKDGTYTLTLKNEKIARYLESTDKN